jgi:hypothetical protein
MTISTMPSKNVFAPPGVPPGLVKSIPSSVTRSTAARAETWIAARAGELYLPMRGTDTPTPAEVAAVAGAPFQSMTCLGGCARSPRFAAIGWDLAASWCSYTRARRPLPSLDHTGLVAALDGLGLVFCGDAAASPVPLRSRRGRSPRAPARTGGGPPE